MRLRWAGVAVVAGGLLAFLACTSFGEEEETPPPDPDAGSVDAGADAPGDAGPCNLDKKFGSFVPLKGETPLSVETARPIGDNLDDIISSACIPNALSSCELYRTNLEDLGMGRGKLDLLSGANAEESFPSVRTPVNQVFFARGAVDGGPASPRSLFMAPSPTLPPIKLPIAPPAITDKEPYLVGDTLYFAREITAGAGRIWSIDVDDRGMPLGNAALMPLPFQGSLYSPVVSSDRNEIFLVVEGLPKFALEAARRVGSSQDFEKTQPFSDLPADPTVYPVWLSSDRCTLWVVTKATNKAPGRVHTLTRPKN